MLALAPAATIAEVSDKMPTVGALLVQGAAVGTVLFCLSRIRWWFAIPGVLISLCYSIWSTAALFFGPFRDDLLHEQGVYYFVCAAASDLLVFIGPLAGAALAWRRRHDNQPIVAPAPRGDL